MISPLTTLSNHLPVWAQTEQTYHQFTRLQTLSEGWHWLLLLVICGLILSFVIVMYRRDCVELPVGTSIALMFLRSVAFFGILFFFLNLEKLTEQTLTKNSRALVLIDTSQPPHIHDMTRTRPVHELGDEMAEDTHTPDIIRPPQEIVDGLREVGAATCGGELKKLGIVDPTIGGPTAFTPGMASAAEVSIDTMRAWPWGDRRNTPCNWPGRLRSAAKRALPTTLS